MEITPAVQIFAFVVFALIAVAGALGMATTMSMFRSGIFLMASFIGVAGLFIMLLADLLGLLQVMMYIGGMLVMILFMVLFSHDPGGEMMAGMMELPLIEKFFSLGLAHKEEHKTKNIGQQKQKHNGEKQNEQHDGAGNHNTVQGESGVHVGQGGEGDHAAMQGMEDMKMGGMDMSEMSMTTPVKKQAAVLAALIGLLLGALIVLRPAWKLARALPDQNSASRVGEMLMGKYMMAFEGAGLLILLGIFGSVMVSRPARHTDASEREKLKAAVDAKPAPVEIDPLEPLYKTDLLFGQDKGAGESAHSKEETRKGKHEHDMHAQGTHGEKLK